MARKVRVIQSATGVVGSEALKSTVRHPKLELVGVKVYSDDKKGLDAGDLAGIEEMCRLLESGKHVITPCPYWFPFIQNSEVAASIAASCRKGQVNFHASGCNSGLKTYLDLPMITGCMGMHATER